MNTEHQIISDVVEKKDLVIIKYGGGLITYKDKLCEANYEHINGLSRIVEELASSNKQHIVVIHGAGSFGHLKAKQFKLHLGLL